MLSPQSFSLERPAGAAEPVGNKLIDADPLFAVVAVPDHHPEIAVGSKNAAPLAAKFGS
jgi:hypothetical protein